MNSDTSPLLSIICTAYNHEEYIAQALDSLLVQNTNFNFELLITDDFSTDKTTIIIQSYVERFPNIIIPFFHKENLYCKSNFFIDELLLNARGKYIALCEGDDYWTDPYKLQKQVDFLESHPDYNLCCHNWEIDTQGVISPSPVHDLYKEPLSFDFGTLPWVWITKTVTLMFRNHAFDYNLLTRYQLGRDVHLVYHLLETGKGYYMPEIMAHYRIHEGGVWSKHKANEKNKTTYELYKELYSFEKSKAVRKRYLNAALAYFNGLLYSRNTFTGFWKNWIFFFQCFSLIRDVKDIIFLCGALFPPKFVKFVMGKFKV